MKKIKFNNSKWFLENNGEWIEIDEKDWREVKWLIWNNPIAKTDFAKSIAISQFKFYQPTPDTEYQLSEDVEFEIKEEYCIDGNWQYVHRSDVEMLDDDTFKPENNRKVAHLKVEKKEHDCIKYAKINCSCPDGICNYEKQEQSEVERLREELQNQIILRDAAIQGCNQRDLIIREREKDYSDLGVKFDKELERWQERDSNTLNRIKELENKLTEQSEGQPKIIDIQTGQLLRVEGYGFMFGMVEGRIVCHSVESV